jgi:hypothetical protein
LLFSLLSLISSQLDLLSSEQVGSKHGNIHTSLRAKRSNPESHKASLDCFVAAFIAMTLEIRYLAASPPPRHTRVATRTEG